MHTASSTPLHEPRQAPASLSRPLWLQTPTICCRSLPTRTKTTKTTLFPSPPHLSQFDILLYARLHGDAWDKECSSALLCGGQGAGPAGGCQPVRLPSHSFPREERAENWFCILKAWILPKISIFWRATAANGHSQSKENASESRVRLCELWREAPWGEMRFVSSSTLLSLK